MQFAYRTPVSQVARQLLAEYRTCLIPSINDLGPMRWGLFDISSIRKTNNCFSVAIPSVMRHKFCEVRQNSCLPLFFSWNSTVPRDERLSANPYYCYYQPQHAHRKVLRAHFRQTISPGL